VPYNKISQHYLGKKHQQLLLKFIKQILPQYSRGHSKLVFQKTVDEQYQRNLTECLGKMELLIQEINPKIADCARPNTERQAIETKINEQRTQLAKKIKELSDNSTKLLESLVQILASMDKLLDTIKSNSVTDTG
jgi:methyl-accepting chemotaxis protein